MKTGKFLAMAIVLYAISFISCSNLNAKSNHMSFMGITLDGTREECLRTIESNFKDDSLFGNLELNLDSINHKSFICSQNGIGADYANIWVEFFFFVEPYNNQIVGLQGWSLMEPRMYNVLRISLVESLGAPVYDQNSLTPELMYELDIHEACVYNDLETERHEIWKTDVGYIILQRDPSQLSEDICHVELDIIDKANFDKYVDAQLTEQNE